MKTLVLFLSLALSLAAQTVINGGRTILGPWDASGATTTKPAKSGTATPGTCAVGEEFFETDATAGNNKWLCTATNVWTQQTAAPASSGVTPDHTVVWLDDDLFTGSVTNTQVGMYGWNSGAVSAINSEVNHPGIYRATTPASANSVGYIATGYGAVKAIPPLDTTTNWEVVIIFRTGSSLDSSKFRAGLIHTTAYTEASPTTGIFLEHLSATSGCTSNPGAADTTWMWVRGNGSTTRVAGPAIAISTWYRLRIRSTTIGEFRASLSTNGGAYSTEEVYTTSIPTVSTYAMVQVVTCDTAAKVVDIDKISYVQTGLSR